MATSYDQLKNLALEKRAQYGVVTQDLGLQKIRSIYHAEGITLDYRKTSGKIRAVYMCDDNDPSVMVNGSLPAEPKLFSLVHELKHHYTDRAMIESGKITCGDYNLNWQIEVAAEVFAAEFIFPETEFLELVSTMGLAAGHITPEDIVRFKRECGATVSYQFLRKRFERLNLVSAGSMSQIQFKKLEEELFGPPIYKQPWFKAHRAQKLRQSLPTAR